MTQPETIRQSMNETLAKIARNSRLWLIALGLVGSLFLASPTRAMAATWYVSALSSGTVHDGKSWQTAWWDFSGSTSNQRIDWSKIQPGDKIVIDAGKAPPPGYSSSVIYHTPLVVQKNNITIEVSNEPGHNGGTASIQTNSTTSTSIDLSTYNVQNVTVQGSKWIRSGSPRLTPNLSVLGGGTGLSIGPSNKGIILRNLHISWCKTGLSVKGGQTYGYYMALSDNEVNIKSEASSAGQCYLYWSWIFGQYQGRQSPGIVTNMQTSDFTLGFYYSIMGPGLSTGVETNGTKDTVSLTYSLMINPSVSHVTSTAPPKSLDVSYSIGFETPLNAKGQSHSCLNFTQAPGHTVFGTILYGGVVDVRGSNRLGMYNVQYQTSGNTMVLSPSQVDPRFASDVKSVPNNASFTQLTGLDFTPTNGTPGTPYTMKSVDQLLNRVPQ